MTIEFGVARGIDAQAFGQPGQRTFRLRIVGADGQSASLWMEKEQMQALSLAIKQMLGQLEYNQEPPPPDVGEFPNVAEHDFRVGRMGMGFNPSDRTVVLSGYTDNTGPARVNAALSEARAEVVKTALVNQGILKTAPASDGSAYQEYVLTAKGRGVFPVLVALRQWSEEFSCENGGFKTLLVDRNKGRPVRKLEIRAEDGRLLADGDTELRPNPATKRRRRLSA